MSEKIELFKPDKSRDELLLKEAKAQEKKQEGRKIYKILNGVVITKSPERYKEHLR